MKRGGSGRLGAVVVLSVLLLAACGGAQPPAVLVSDVPSCWDAECLAESGTGQAPQPSSAQRAASCSGSDEPAVPRADGMQVGLIANAGPARQACRIGVLAPPLVRLEFDIDTAPEEIEPYVEAYARVGSRLLLLAGFSGRLPTDDEARGLADWAAAFGPGSGRDLPVAAIEFGNETSYGYQYDDEPGDTSYTQRARRYAQLAAMAAMAVRAADPGVGLLAQADDGGTGTSDWVDEMFTAAPDLGDLVLGWTLHPYGPGYERRLDRTRTDVGAHGSDAPLWITEWGLAVDEGRCLDDNYGWDTCMDDEQAADTLREVVSALPRFGVAAFLVYQGTDQRRPGASEDREHYFGVLRAGGQPKGAYTEAVRALWAGHQ